MGFRHTFIVRLCKEMSSTFFTVRDVKYINNEHNFVLCVVILIEKKLLSTRKYAVMH